MTRNVIIPSLSVMDKIMLAQKVDEYVLPHVVDKKSRIFYRRTRKLSAHGYSCDHSHVLTPLANRVAKKRS